MVSCGAHQPLPFHYVSNGGYSAVPLKTYKIWVDKNFGYADRLAIDDAIKQWNYALNGHVVLAVETFEYDMGMDVLREVVEGRGWVFLRIDSTAKYIPDSQNGQKKYYTLAWVNKIGGSQMWVVRDRLKNEWVEGVIMHEIGHMLGADHDQVYLMQPIYNWEDYRCVDYAALKRVAEYQHIPMSNLNYCVYGEAVNLPSSCKIKPE